MSPRGGQSLGPGDSDFVVVANRLPIDMVRLPDGTTEWKQSPGGLVTAPPGFVSAFPTVCAVLLTVLVTVPTGSLTTSETPGTCGSWALAGAPKAAASATVRAAVLRVEGRTRTPE